MPFIEVKISTKEVNNNLLSISIENIITDKESLNSLKDVWKDNKIDIQKLQNEGKSGYYKAYHIITSDLKTTIPNCINPHLNENENKFCVTLSIDLTNLKV